jgi:hypothetical protein
VVATNALELGIDIGAWMPRCWWAIPAHCRNPPADGTRRARAGASLSGWWLPRHRWTNIDHASRIFLRALTGRGAAECRWLAVVGSHLACAAFELPFERDEPFGLRRRSPRCWRRSAPKGAATAAPSVSPGWARLPCARRLAAHRHRR